MAISFQLSKIRKQLEQEVDADNPIIAEKIERYISLTQRYYEMNEAVGDTLLVPTQTGGFRSNPGLGEKIKINGQLINLSKDMGLSAPPPGAKALENAKRCKVSDLV